MTRALMAWPAAATALCLGLAGAVRADAPDGLWRARGYGMIAEVRAGQTRLYDVTTISCAEAPPIPGITDRMFTEARVAKDGKSLTSKAPWGLTTLHFQRLAALPPACAAAPGDARDPVRNFDVFWSLFDEYYAFFDARGVDWRAIRAEYRPRVTPRTTDEELIEIIAAIFRQLQDRHVSLSVGSKRVNAGFTEIFTRWYADYARNPLGSRNAFLHRQLVEYLSPSWSRNLDAGSVRRISDNITSGTAGGGHIGYAMIGAESGYAGGAVEDDTAAALAQFESVFTGFQGKAGVILDMRINYGGHDAAALALAGLLTNRDRPGFSKCARDGDGYTPVQRTTIRRRSGGFTGPVVVLISSMNWSSGENFAMMVKDFPNVVLVGDHTASVQSDVLTKHLPNGWRITLSNEVFGAADGTLYETIGVQPDVLVPYDPEAVRATGVDPLIEKALHLLGSPDFSRLAAGVKRDRALGRPLPCR